MIEVILWLMFLVPGIIYSIWRLTSRHQACAMCGGTGLIPLDSPVGQRLLLEHGIPTPPPASASTTSAHAAGAALGAAVRRATQPATPEVKVIPPGKFKS